MTTQEDNARTFEIFGFGSSLVQFVLLPLLAKSLAPRRVLLIGVTVQCASTFLQAVAGTKLVSFVITGFATMSFLTFPSGVRALCLCVPL